MDMLKRMGFVLLALLVCLGLPGLAYGVFDPEGVDAVTGASLDLPDQPSGEFWVFLNRERHPDTAEEWRAFFLEQPAGVIMEDLSCMAALGDEAGVQLARRYQARLAEHQMELREEDRTLLASRAELGLFDVLVLSREMAEACGLSGLADRPGMVAVPVGKSAS